MQIIGRPFDEPTVFQVVAAYDAARGAFAPPAIYPRQSCSRTEGSAFDALNGEEVFFANLVASLRQHTIGVPLEGLTPHVAVYTSVGTVSASLRLPTLGRSLVFEFNQFPTILANTDMV